MITKRTLFTITLVTCSFLGISQTIVKPQVLQVDYSGKIYVNPEAVAQFPGGNAAWQKYVGEHLSADTATKNAIAPGSYQMTIRLIVSTDGTVTDVTALTRVGPGVENEVVKIIKKGPKWIPAVHKGKRVHSFKNQELTFIIKEK